MRFNYSLILRMLGVLLIILAGFQVLAVAVSVVYGEVIAPMAISTLISAGCGALLVFLFRHAPRQLRKADGYIVVTLGWVMLVLFGTLPYLLSATIPSYSDALFETMSGFTTTGATILSDIEGLPKPILFYRSLTQWIGGMGIIVFTIAILPLLGIGGMQLFTAEAPGPTADKIHPKITETARRLWALYVVLTGVEVLLLMAGGMDLFDAVNHSFTTIATAGFSTRNESIAAFDSAYIEYVITAFMLIGGTNFTLLYLAYRLRLRKVFRNDEFRTYLGVVLIVGICAFVGLAVAGGGWNEANFRRALFQVTSLITTTGFTTADYVAWSPFLTFLMFMLMFAGGCTGSTSGNIKIMRHVIMVRNGVLELRRQMHPSAILPVRFNKRAVPTSITYNITAFMLAFMVIFFLGTLILSGFGLDFQTAMGACIASLGNVGPGIGDVGPSGNYGHLPDGAKWFLSFLMLLGRLELFTVLVLFTRSFWFRS